MKQYIISIILVIFLTSCSLKQSPVSYETNDSLHVVTSSEVKWEALNPARGDQSPKAATLWGDRKSNQATGFLVQFKDGFSSPPHIHNVSYKGVVISGLIHNDHPKSPNKWMPRGSYWTQPKGQVHITSAKGRVNIAYIEIEEGPYLVRPVRNAFESEERPINMDASNMVWLDASVLSEDNANRQGAEVAFLWGKPKSKKLSGSLLKLPSRFKGNIINDGSKFRSVLIHGKLRLGPKETQLRAGSYFGSQGKALHKVSCVSDKGCILYIRTLGEFKVD